METFTGISPILRWKSQDPGIQLFDDGFTATKVIPDPIRYPSYRSVLSATPLTPGKKYVIGLKFNDLLSVKVGLCSNNDPANLSKAFSDTSNGWALMTSVKELRHDNFRQGPSYQFTTDQNMIFILLDSVKGTLSFGTEYADFGIAFECEEFRRLPMYVAVAFKSMNSSVSFMYQHVRSWRQRLFALWATSMRPSITVLSRLPAHIVREIVVLI